MSFICQKAYHWIQKNKNITPASRRPTTEPDHVQVFASIEDFICHLFQEHWYSLSTDRVVVFPIGNNVKVCICADATTERYFTLSYTVVEVRYCAHVTYFYISC